MYRFAVVARPPVSSHRRDKNKDQLTRRRPAEQHSFNRKAVFQYICSRPWGCISRHHPSATDHIISNRNDKHKLTACILVMVVTPNFIIRSSSPFPRPNHRPTSSAILDSLLYPRYLSVTTSAIVANALATRNPESAIYQTPRIWCTR